MELVVIRHGQSLADIEGRHEGRADFPLTDLGREQARKMAAWVARECPPEAIWASPLKRAAEVASILSQATMVPVRHHEGLMEWNNGHLAGLTYQEALEKYPPPRGRRLPHVPIPGGESEIQFRARVEATWHEILAEHAGEGDPGLSSSRIAIVAHGGTIAMLFRAFLRLPLETDVSLATGDTGIHRWRISPDRRVVLLANSTAHLER
ncbi:MAG: histidine phosphatase family protein [Bacillota bacterium]